MYNLNNLLNTYWLNSILTQREVLRIQKRYTEADKVRGDLRKIGIEVIDTRLGPTWEFTKNV